MSLIVMCLENILIAFLNKETEKETAGFVASSDFAAHIWISQVVMAHHRLLFLENLYIFLEDEDHFFFFFFFVQSSTFLFCVDEFNLFSFL